MSVEMSVAGGDLDDTQVPEDNQQTHGRIRYIGSLEGKATHRQPLMVQVGGTGI